MYVFSGVFQLDTVCSEVITVLICLVYTCMLLIVFIVLFLYSYYYYTVACVSIVVTSVEYSMYMEYFLYTDFSIDQCSHYNYFEFLYDTVYFSRSISYTLSFVFYALFLHGVLYIRFFRLQFVYCLKVLCLVRYFFCIITFSTYLYSKLYFICFIGYLDTLETAQYMSSPLHQLSIAISSMYLYVYILSFSCTCLLIYGYQWPFSFLMSCVCFFLFFCLDYSVLLHFCYTAFLSTLLYRFLDRYKFLMSCRIP